MHDTPPGKFNLVQMHRISWSINAQDKEQNKIFHKSMAITLYVFDKIYPFSIPYRSFLI